MNVNQHTPMATPYGQSHPGYGQPNFPSLDGGYPAAYAPYNGPASAYQPGAPPQGKPTISCVFELRGASVGPPPAAGSQPFHSPSSHTNVNLITFLYIAPPTFSHLPAFSSSFQFLHFQVTLLSPAFPLRQWLPPQSLTSPLLSIWVTDSSFLTHLSPNTPAVVGSPSSYWRCT